MASKFFTGLSNFIKRSHQAAHAEAPEVLPEPPLATTLDDDPDNIEGMFARFKEGLQDIIRDPNQLQYLILYYSIRLLDSGGQPQFHEVVSILLPAVTGIISVFKLSERLNVHGEVVFYRDGEQTNDPYKSYLTNEQVIRHIFPLCNTSNCTAAIVLVRVQHISIITVALIATNSVVASLRAVVSVLTTLINV